MVGGAERQCELLARALFARGHNVRVLTVRPDRGIPIHDVVSGVPVERVAYPIIRLGNWRVGCGFLAPILLGWRVWRCARTVDVVMAHQALWPAFVACVAARLRRRPVIVKLGNSGERFDLAVLRQTHWYGMFAARFLMRNVTMFVATSTAVRSDLGAAGVPTTRIAEIANGVDVPLVVPMRSVADRIRYIAVGSLTPKKNFHTLFDAIAQLDADARARCTWTIVGDGALREALHAHATALGLGSTVAFAGEVQDVPSLLAVHDVFVLPSRTEGLSNAVLEAMAHGLPLLLSDVGGNRDLVPGACRASGAPYAVGATGLLVHAETPDAITAAFRWFLAHPTESLAMGRVAREQVREQYAIARTSAQYEERIRAVVTPPPRVVHLVTFLDEQTGGMERQALQLVRGLQQRGYQCFFITCARVDRMWRDRLPLVGAIEGIRIYRIPFIRGWRRWNACWYGVVSCVLLFALRRQYDCIHAHQLQTSGTVASVVRRWLPSKRLIVKDAAGGATGDVTELRRLLGGRVIPMLRQRVDRFVAVSQEVAEELASIGCAPVIHIPNSVDDDRFRPPDVEERRRARVALMGSEASAITFVLTVGRLHPQKNIAMLIDAIAMLAPSYVLMIVGDGSERGALERHARERGAHERVRCIGAVADVRPYYHAADIFVIPSRSEGLPNVVLEAMACGLPVTGSDIPSIRAILPPALQACLVAPDDPVELSASIRRLAVGGVHGYTVGDVRRHVTAHYRLDTIVERYGGMYRELMDTVLA